MSVQGVCVCVWGGGSPVWRWSATFHVRVMCLCLDSAVLVHILLLLLSDCDSAEHVPVCTDLWESILNNNRVGEVYPRDCHIFLLQEGIRSVSYTHLTLPTMTLV